MIDSELNEVIKVGIIGAGGGALSLLQIFEEDDFVDVVGIAYRSLDRPSIDLARKMNIPLFADFRDLVRLKGVALLIDASGNDEVTAYVEEHKSDSTDYMSGGGAHFLWRMVDEYEENKNEMTRVLLEHESLYSAGVMLASAANTEHTLDLIMESALNLTGMKAGSIALYDEERGMMQIKISLGFDADHLRGNYSWKVSAGGLTGHILSNTKPTVINDLTKEKKLEVQPLLDMGVKAIVAAPLRVEGKIVGVLYVDDFEPRTFTDREINILNLLGVQAAAAIDKALLLEKTENLAVTDDLTKLYNHRYFVRSLEKEIKRATRYGHPLSLCMIDVDHFKNYNDTFGHPSGNIILKTLSGILCETARESDIVARYGGEEFAIILVQTDKDKAAYVAERMRQEVEAHYFEGEEKQPGGSVTISIGVSTYDPNDEGEYSQKIIEMADVALYKSKEDGRNRVTSFDATSKAK